MGKPENEEVAWGGAFSERIRDGLDVGVRHFERVVRFGCVVEEGVDDCGGELWGGGVSCSYCGGGDCRCRGGAGG